MSKLDPPACLLLICEGSKCRKRNDAVRQVFKHQIKAYGLKKSVEIVYTECTGRCKLAPVVIVQPANAWYGEVTLRQAEQLFERHVLAEAVGTAE